MTIEDIQASDAAIDRLHDKGRAYQARLRDEPSAAEVATVAAPMYAVWTIEYSRDFREGGALTGGQQREVRQIAIMQATALIDEARRQLQERGR